MSIEGGSIPSSSTNMNQTNAYEFFAKRIQDIFNFAVLVTSSVPVLKYNLKLFEQNKITRIPDPDFFETSVIYELKQESINQLKSDQKISEDQESALLVLKGLPLSLSNFKSKLIHILGRDLFDIYRNSLKIQSIKHIENLRACTVDYKEKLSTYLYFSNFSYFESFLIDIAEEAISSTHASNIEKHFTDTITTDLVKARTKLNKEEDLRKLDTYKKYSKILDDEGYLTPDEILAASMKEYIIEKLKNLYTKDVFDFLKKILGYQISPSDMIEFGSIRQNRNEIAHGKHTFTPNLADVISTNKFYKRISKDINNHVMLHFSKIKNFRKP